MSPETITLYFREGSSDKVYTASLEKSGAGWVVLFAYGRRGSTMNTGTKTSSPVEFEKAKKIFDKLVSEKTGKGYTPGEDGAVYKGTSSEERDTGVRVQLLNDIDEAEVERLTRDDAWGMQEKMDGRRLVVKKVGKDIIGINRKGLTVGLAEPVITAMRAAKGDLVIDGEAVGDVLHAFDILHLDGDIRHEPYRHRWALLAALRPAGAVKLVPLALTTVAKRKLLVNVRADRGEGVVFKRLDAQYTAGRPDSGGTQLKYKFYATGSFIVAKINQKRSVALKLHDGTAIGNATIPPNKEVPALGSIVEIRYLYCFQGGSLYQPTYLGGRDDLELSACNGAQLKFRASDDLQDIREDEEA